MDQQSERAHTYTRTHVRTHAHVLTRTETKYQWRRQETVATIIQFQVNNSQAVTHQG